MIKVSVESERSKRSSMMVKWSNQVMTVSVSMSMVMDCMGSINRYISSIGSNWVVRDMINMFISMFIT